MESSFYQTMVILSISVSHLLPSCASASNTKHFKFNVEWKRVTRLCHTKSVLTVNGKFPGPTIIVHQGDNVEVLVTNALHLNTTIHWHGIRQMQSGWSDGPAYITQCPIGSGKAYTYKFNVGDQKGTLWWHAHFGWQRASVHGAFIIYPRMPFPFSAPTRALQPLILGEWWNRDVDSIENEMSLYGRPPPVSDAYTLNGLPGPLYPCSTTKDTWTQIVEPGNTYLLRIINAALNGELFFAVANHTLTVVEIDGVYTKPLATSAIMVAPGQTINVLIKADQDQIPNTIFLMAARPYITCVFPCNNSTTIGYLKYQYQTTTKQTRYIFPSNLPQRNDTPFATNFLNSLKSLGSNDYPCKVPRIIDTRVVTTVSLNLQDCSTNQTCQGYKGKRFYASMNNQSFIRPSISLLQSHYYNLTTGFSTDFPHNPPYIFNYTGVEPLGENLNTEFGTKVVQVPFGTKLEIVLQGTNLLNPENHPIHVHGHNFFIVGRGIGNFDVGSDPGKYNLVDPAERNTVAVPMGGWAAIRVVTDNPGVWFIHCHLEEHTSWGLSMVLIVESGKETWERLLPPPTDLPQC